MTRSSGCDQHRRGVHGVAIPGSDPHSTTGLQPTVHGITKDRSDHPGGVIRLEAPDSLRGGGFAIPEARQFHRRSCKYAPIRQRTCRVDRASLLTRSWYTSPDIGMSVKHRRSFEPTQTI